MDASEQTLRLSRPSGTLGIFCSRQPSDKSLGYCQMSPRDKGLALPARNLEHVTKRDSDSDFPVQGHCCQWFCYTLLELRVVQ